MEKVQRNKKIWLISAIASAAFGLASVAGIVIFAMKLLYLPLGICIALVANAFYGCPFYLIAFGNSRLCERAIKAICETGLLDIDSISEAIMAKPKFARTIVEKCINKGYIKGYAFDGDKLIPQPGK